jgi:hypothetical protein
MCTTVGQLFYRARDPTTQLPLPDLLCTNEEAGKLCKELNKLLRKGKKISIQSPAKVNIIEDDSDMVNVSELRAILSEKGDKPAAAAAAAPSGAGSSLANYVNFRSASLDDRCVQNLVVALRELLPTESTSSLSSPTSSLSSPTSPLALCLTGNGFTAYGIQELLGHQIPFSALFLSNNSIAPSSASLFSPLLTNPQSTLHTLSLNHNPLPATFLPSLAEFLPSSNITILGLTSARVDDAGCVALLCAALRKEATGSSGLRKIFLNSNSITDGSAPTILNFIDASASIERFGLAMNELTDSTGTELATAIAKSPSLSRVCLNGNQFSIAVLQLLSQVGVVNLARIDN